MPYGTVYREFERARQEAKDKGVRPPPPPPLPPLPKDFRIRTMLHVDRTEQAKKELEMNQLERDLRRIVEKHASEGASIETIQFLINQRVKAEKLIREALPKPTKKSDKQAQSFIGGMVVGALVASYIFSIFLV